MEGAFNNVLSEHSLRPASDCQKQSLLAYNLAAVHFLRQAKECFAHL